MTSSADRRTPLPPEPGRPTVEPTEPPDPVDPSAHADPVAAVRRAHVEGRRLGLRTSGTTGNPRLVVRSTDSWWRSFPAYGALSGISATSRVWVPGPLTATMNLFAAVHAVVTGAALLTDPVTDPPDHRATHVVLAPHQLVALRGRLPAGTTVVVAGDTLSPDLAADARDSGLVVHHYYGASELSFVAWGTHAEDLAPFPGVEVTSRAGVLWSRSPFHAELTDADRDDAGWASVGDLGTVEQTAYGPRVRVGGRGDQAVTTAGATVRVGEVEQALAVARPTGRFAVVGLPHERLGQVPAAVVEREEDLDPLRAEASSALDAAARPRVWLVARHDWPTTPDGRTDRTRLAAQAAAGELRRLGRRGSGRSD